MNALFLRARRAWTALRERTWPGNRARLSHTAPPAAPSVRADALPARTRRRAPSALPPRVQSLIMALNAVADPRTSALIGSLSQMAPGTEREEELRLLNALIVTAERQLCFAEDTALRESDPDSGQGDEAIYNARREELRVVPTEHLLGTVVERISRTQDTLLGYVAMLIDGTRGTSSDRRGLDEALLLADRALHAALALCLWRDGKIDGRAAIDQALSAARHLIGELDGLSPLDPITHGR